MAELTFDTIDPRKRNIIMIGLAIGLLVACFDGTITTTCGPQIAKDFNANDLLPWLTTAYLLLETVTIPLSGKLSDLYGRKKLLLIGLVLFILASLVAGLAGIPALRFDGGMWVVIGARALQGAGGGILIPVATAAVSDLYPPEERAKIQGILGALFGIGMGAGPLIGGAFASMDLWCLAFFINIPIVIIVFLMCRGEFPSVVTEGKPIIDYKGIALISAALVAVVLLFQFLGKKETGFPVISWQTLIFAVIIVGVLSIFVWHEKRAKEPIMAPHVFANPTVRGAAIILFLLGFTLVGDELFMSLYLQTVTGHDAITAGLFLLFMVGGMMITSVVGGSLMNKTGAKPWLIGGTLLMMAGFVLFSLIEPEFNIVLFSISEFIYGLGGGCILATLMACVQNSCSHEEVGMTTSAVNLMRNIGATVGTSVFTLIVNAAIKTESFEESFWPIGPSGKPEIINELAEMFSDAGIGILNFLIDTIFPDLVYYHGTIKSIFTSSISIAFLVGAILLLIALIVAIRFKIVTVAQTKEISKFETEVIKDNKKV